MYRSIGIKIYLKELCIGIKILYSSSALKMYFISVYHRSHKFCIVNLTGQIGHG